MTWMQDLELDILEQANAWELPSQLIADVQSFNTASKSAFSLG